MLSDPDLQAWLDAQALTVISVRALSGGCVARSSVLELSDGRRLFLKQQDDAEPGLFAAEARGLQALVEAGGLQTPAVIWYGAQSLLLKYLVPAPRGRDFSEQLALGLARQHRQHADRFGFDCDTFCGGTRQPNRWNADGHAFFADNRLMWLGRECVSAGLLGTRTLTAIERLCERLPDLIPEQPAALLHGDLWGGNVHTGPDGTPVLIDPAVYFGWPEADLAMTCLFGGFDRRFYEVYEAHGTLAPGWRGRTELYNLWHLLNHLRLFGDSYRDQIENVLDHYVGRV